LPPAPPFYGERVVLVFAKEQFEVLACGKIPACTANDYYLGIGVHLQMRQRFFHLVVQLRAHGVAFFGAVHPHIGDAVGQFHFYAFKMVEHLNPFCFTCRFFGRS